MQAHERTSHAHRGTEEGITQSTREAQAHGSRLRAEQEEQAHPHGLLATLKLGKCLQHTMESHLNNRDMPVYALPVKRAREF